MIEILEKKIYFSNYGTSKYRCKWRYKNELGVRSEERGIKGGKTAIGMDCRVATNSRLEIPSRSELSSVEASPVTDCVPRSPSFADAHPSGISLAMTDTEKSNDEKVNNRMQYELINMIDPANYGGYVVVQDYCGENEQPCSSCSTQADTGSSRLRSGIFTGTVVIYYD